MRVRVRLFASLREATGRSELEVELPEAASAEDAWKVLVAGHPALAGRRGGHTAAGNRRYVPFDHPLADGDEVVFVPPVSGGSTSFTAETRR